MNLEKKIMLEQDKKYCAEMLPKVSRTFAPAIRMLPDKLFMPVTVAYLLCRIADTIEDEPLIERTAKKKILADFASIFKDGQNEKIENVLKSFGKVPVYSADVDLLFNSKRILNVYYTFSRDVQNHISIWVVEMSLGMKKFAQSSDRSKFQFLKSMKELDEYTYYVAGTVGHLLTSLFSHFSGWITPNVKKRLEPLSSSFGKGLQMVNIIRDMAVDLRRGQSYIPDEILAKYQLTRQSIYDAQNTEKAQLLFNELIQNAVNHLDHALAYIITIPKKEARIRLFCLLPMFWAMRTLQKIQLNTLALLENEKIKISRRIIKTEYYKAMVFAFSNRLTIRHYNKIRRYFALKPARL